MKKSIVLILAVTLAVVPSCKNKGQKAKDQAQTPATEIDFNNKEQVTTELLKADAQTFIESASKIKPAPFASAKKDGRITLTEKEKLVKPTYLLDPAVVKDLVTFSQKYRAAGMLAVDKAIADLYETKGNEINSALLAVVADLGDEAINTFASTPWIDLETSKDAMRNFATDEYAAGREVYFWEGVAACLVEQIYVITRDIDKFMPMFTDETASDVTYNFVILHEGIRSLVAIKPEMESLNQSLDVLYKINAISVKQLREQLSEIKNDIVDVRNGLLK